MTPEIRNKGDIYLFVSIKYILLAFMRRFLGDKILFE